MTEENKFIDKIAISYVVSKRGMPITIFCPFHIRIYNLTMKLLLSLTARQRGKSGKF